MGYRNLRQEKRTLYFSVTDGNLWKIYETHRPVPIDEKLVAEFELESQPAAETCLKALALWKLRVHHVAAGPAPFVGPDSQPTKPTGTPIPNIPSSPRPDEHEWQELSNLNLEKYFPPPGEIRFPDNSVSQVETWKSLLVEVVKWLVENGHLTEDDCPILRNLRATRYMISTEPVHWDGKPFREYRRVGSFCVETYNDNKSLVDSSRHVIERAGQDPAQFRVR